MRLLLLPMGLLLPTLGGWALVRLLEWKTPVLTPVARWALGFLLGTTIVTYLAFLGSAFAGLPLSRAGWLGVQALFAAATGVPWLRLRDRIAAPDPAPHPSAPLGRNARIAAGILGVWSGAKFLIVAVTFLLLVPVYLDDTYDNWNLRGKVFFHTEALTLQLPRETLEESLRAISSYPPSVPLTKAMLASLAGGWSEPLVNGVHALWYLAIVLLLYASLRRLLSLPWALLGTYVFLSLPLTLMHGTNAYADAFLSAHVFAAACMLFGAVRAPPASEKTSFLRLFGVALALLPFTKNEGLLLHFLPLALLGALALGWMAWSGRLGRREAVRSALWIGLAVAAVLIPWLGFKWANGMSFANAKPIGSLGFSWKPGVLFAITVNTFFEGNWLLLFPLFFGLLALEWRTAFRTPLLALSAFFLIVYVGQLPIYMFTALATEATKQTGYARGLVQLMPVIVLITTVLLERFWTTRVAERLENGGE